MPNVVEKLTRLLRATSVVATCLLTTLVGRAQTITNIRTDATAERLKITYDITGITVHDSVYVRVESRSRGLLNARTVTGDIGRGMQPGTNKVAYWDYPRDNERLTDEFRVTINVDRNVVGRGRRPATTLVGQRVGGGPLNALLSAALPGVGNIFVQPGRKIGLRPLVTVSYVGLLAYGLGQRSRARAEYATYNEQLNRTAAQPYYDAANRYHQRYLLATRAAAAIWATDVTLTLLRGLKNDRLRRAGGPRVSVHYVAGAPVFGFHHTF